MCIGKRMKKTELSNFDRNEEFDYGDIPQYFESISHEGLETTERQYSEKLDKKLNKDNKEKEVSPEEILEDIFNEYTEVYKTFKGDYDTRRDNLKKAYDNGKVEIRNRLATFELTADDHNKTFDQYAESLENVNGSKLDRNLRYDLDKLENIKEEIKKLGKANHE